MANNDIRYYRIGGLRIRYEGPEIDEQDYLKVFREEEDSAITYEVTDPEVSEEALDSSDIHFTVENPDPDMTYNSRFFMLKLKLPARVLEFDAAFLHASYILWHGKAILFTAPKQTGKSTQAHLWEKYKGAEIINGDRALLRKSQQGEWNVYGSPYCGTSGICKNKTAPLAAIVILGQAPENMIRPANVGERVQAMLDGCSYDTSDRQQVQWVMDLTMNIVQEVPFLVLNCLPDHTAADVLEDYLCRMKILS